MWPTVYKPGTNKKGKKIGRGFSLGELKAVGLNPKKALKLGLRVDKRRKSIHQENIELLKTILKKTKG